MADDPYESGEGHFASNNPLNNKDPVTILTALEKKPSKPLEKELSSTPNELDTLLKDYEQTKLEESQPQGEIQINEVSNGTTNEPAAAVDQFQTEQFQQYQHQVTALETEAYDLEQMQIDAANDPYSYFPEFDSYEQGHADFSEFPESDQAVNELCQAMNTPASYQEYNGMVCYEPTASDLYSPYQASTSSPAFEMYGSIGAEQSKMPFPSALPHLSVLPHQSTLLHQAALPQQSTMSHLTMTTAPSTSSTPTLRELLSPSKPKPSELQVETPLPKKSNSRESRNKAEKKRRDEFNAAVAELARIVPTVAALNRKVDKITVLRMTAHFKRAYIHVFGNLLHQDFHAFQDKALQTIVTFFKGFLLVVTYRGLVVVVSENIQDFLGYKELDLVGTSLFDIVHIEDHKKLREELMPRSCKLGRYGELVIPDEPGAVEHVAKLLSQEKREFIVRFKKMGYRSVPPVYVAFFVDGFMRKSDDVHRGSGFGPPRARRARARSDNPYSSGNDVVFVGMARPYINGFKTEGIMESRRMEYQTRHSVDGEILQCDSRISLVTGYMRQEVIGVNAMKFMHRDDVRWVIVALSEMFKKQRVYGESCYRLLTKQGQFIYMRTRGQVDVDERSKTVTTFVCTNTVMGETEGKFLLDQMRKKYSILVNTRPCDSFMEEISRRDNTSYDKNSVPVEEPQHLEQVIVQMITNLPSSVESELGENKYLVIPPSKERVIKAIKNTGTGVFVNKEESAMKKDSHDKNDIHGSDNTNKVTKGDQVELSATSESQEVVESVSKLREYDWLESFNFDTSTDYFYGESYEQHMTSFEKPTYEDLSSSTSSSQKYPFTTIETLTQNLKPSLMVCTPMLSQATGIPFTTQSTMANCISTYTLKMPVVITHQTDVLVRETEFEQNNSIPINQETVALPSTSATQKEDINYEEQHDYYETTKHREFSPELLEDFNAWSSDGSYETLGAIDVTDFVLKTKYTYDVDDDLFDIRSYIEGEGDPGLDNIVHSFTVRDFEMYVIELPPRQKVELVNQAQAVYSTDSDRQSSNGDFLEPQPSTCSSPSEKQYEFNDTVQLQESFKVAVTTSIPFDDEMDEKDYQEKQLANLQQLTSSSFHYNQYYNNIHNVQEQYDYQQPSTSASFNTQHDAKNCETHAKNCEIHAKNCEIHAKNCEIHAKNCETQIQDDEPPAKKPKGKGLGKHSR